VLLCKGSGADEVFEEGLADLKSWMITRKTERQIRDILIKGLDSWYKGQSLDTAGMAPRHAQAVLKQQLLGWKALLEGMPVKEWATLQQERYDHTKSLRTGKRWVSALVKKLAETAWNMWEHRNQINNQRDTATISLEINQQIEEEFELGFQGLDPAARRLSNKHKPRLMRQQLGYHKHWLQSIRVSREYQRKLIARNQVPCWVTETIGLVEWIRLG
jgi:hypothetical protein